MNGFHRLGLVIASSALLSSCIDTHDPFATIRSVVHSARKSELKDFQACFSKTVREELGTEEKMSALKVALPESEEYRFGPAVLTYVEQGYQGYGKWGDVLRKFDLSVLNASSEVELTSTLVCGVWVTKQLDKNYCDTHHYDCDDDYRLVESQDCRILSLDF